ncbi:hypothetical protein ACHAQC_011111 [Fusarium culmorum]
MSEGTRYQWKESSTGLWHRSIDECEQFYRLYTKPEHGCYPITACASFQGKDSNVNPGANVECALRNAWTFLRYRHPTLGSSIEGSDQADTWERVYRPFQTGDDIESWLNSTFKIIETDESALSWFNNYAPSFHMPMVYVVQSGLEAQQTVFLRCPHDITDGVGILQLLDQLFVHAAKFYGKAREFKYPLPDTDLGTRLSPSLRVAASIPDLLSEAQTKLFQELQTTNGNICNHPCLMGLPTSDYHDSAPDMKRIAVSVSREVSSQVLVGCKKIAPGVSLTHVFIAALTMALGDLQPPQDKTYTARPNHAAAAYHAVSSQALGIDIRVPGSADDDTKVDALSELAVRVRDLYQKLKPDLSNNTHEQALFAPQVFQTLSPPPGVDPWAVQKAPFCPVALSSIGNLTTIVGGSDGVFELTKVWVASQPISAGVALFLASWDGQIELSSVFNAQYHDGGFVERFITKILTHVSKGLGIDGDGRAIVSTK